MERPSRSRVVARASETLQDAARDKSVFAWMDDSAAACASFGAARSLISATLACRIKDFEMCNHCALAALHITGECNVVADFVAQVNARSPHPTLRLQDKFLIMSTLK